MLGAGLSDKVAVASLAGTSWSKFEGQWKAYLQRKGYRQAKGKHVQRLYFRGEHNESEELRLLTEKSRQYTWLGDQLRLKGHLLAAEKEYRKAAKLSGKLSPIIQAKLGYVLIRRGKLRDAIRMMKNAVASHPGYVLLSLYLGKAHAGVSEWEKARTYLEQAVMLNPFDPDVHKDLARVYRALGNEVASAREERLQRILEERLRGQ